MMGFRVLPLLAIHCALLLGSINGILQCQPGETCCTDYAIKGPDGKFSDGVNQFCAPKSRGCQRAQGPDKDGKCQSMPNKNRIPPCKEGTYCCIKYQQTEFTGVSYPQAMAGFDLTCQPVNTGCPEFFQGFGTIDCSQHYPNYNVQPVYDCPAGQKCCWTKPAKFMDGSPNDKVLMTCVPVKEACPQDLKSNADLKCPRS